MHQSRGACAGCRLNERAHCRGGDGHPRCLTGLGEQHPREPRLLDTAGEITLVHRREGFRAHEATVAEVMGLNAATVKTRMFYARKKLAELAAAA